MSKFKLPSILESSDEPSEKPEGFPSLVEDESLYPTSVIDPIMEEIDVDSIIEEIDVDSVTHEEEDPFIEETFELDDEMIDEEDATSHGVGKVTGVVQDVKIDMSEELTVIKLETNDGIVYLRIPYVEYAAEKGFLISSEYDEDETTVSKSGVTVYESFNITVISVDGQKAVEEKKPLRKKERKNNGISSWFKNAIDAVKDEAGSSRKDDTDDYEDSYSEDDYDDDEDIKPKERDKKGSRKPKNKRRGIYSSIANVIYSVIMGAVGFLSKVPIVGRIVSILNLLDPVIKFLSMLWLPILLLFLWGGVSTVTNIVDKVSNSSSSSIKGDKLSNEEVKLVVTNKKYSNGEVNVDFVNTSDYYVDFYFTGEIKEKGFNGDVIECKSPVSVLPPDEKSSVTLKCDSNPKDAKIKRIDIALSN